LEISRKKSPVEMKVQNIFILTHRLVTAFGTGCTLTVCGDINCSKCCHDREIVLTHHDIDRLLTMGHYEQTFARPSRWGHNLKELIFFQGECIFLQKGKCSVYSNRPTACRIFPMTMGESGMEIDPSCPHGQVFKNDQVFMKEAGNGLQRIIEDVQRTLAIAGQE